ncbi:hypothetical protein TTRE_0000130001 [Trichuris trichiura]|uniref:Uncharacterized protein n=1 Tax=Trichuris trichiura TaxID=36087 RepID=A0A077YY33_TRITR|nr:hypothetical protein TTRE_0000130001 [Trichuris trichiura]
MFGVVVFGLHQDLRFIHFDEHLESRLTATAFGDDVASFSSKYRQAEFSFLPLLVLCETYQLRFEDRISNIASATVSVDLSEQDGLTVVLIRGPNTRISMDTVKAVLRLCFGPLLGALSLEKLQEQSLIAERLLRELTSVECCQHSLNETDVLINSNLRDCMNKQHVTIAKIIILFLKMFFSDSLDGVVYVEQGHRTNLYCGRKWSSRMLFLLVKLSCLVDDQSAPSHRISAFVQLDDDACSLTAVDVYFYRLSVSVCLFGIVRMRHSNLLTLLSSHFMELELVRTNAYRNTEDSSFNSAKLVERHKSFVRRLKVELKKCDDSTHLHNLQTALNDVTSRLIERKSKLKNNGGDVISSMRKVGSILREMLDRVYSLYCGRVEQSNLDLFNVCCESLLCASQIGYRQLRKCVFEKVLHATGPLASTLDFDAEAYVFGMTNGHLRLQSGRVDLVNLLLLIRFDQLAANLYCFRYQQYVCILIKRTYAEQLDQLKSHSFKKLMQLARRQSTAKNSDDNFKKDSAYIVAAYAGFINLSLALWQTWYLAEQLHDLVEQSWQFHPAPNA